MAADRADDRRVQAGESRHVERRTFVEAYDRLARHVAAGHAALGHGGVPEHVERAATLMRVPHLGHVAGRVDMRLARLQVLVDQDPAVAGEPASLAEDSSASVSTPIATATSSQGTPRAVGRLDAGDPAAAADGTRADLGEPADAHAGRGSASSSSTARDSASDSTFRQ